MKFKNLQPEITVRIVGGHIVREVIRPKPNLVLSAKPTAAQRRMSESDREGSVFISTQIGEATVALAKNEIQEFAPCKKCWEPAVSGSKFCEAHGGTR